MKFKLKDVGAVRQFQRLVPQRAAYVKKMAGIMAYERLSRQAPVLTGRYRWGFNPSVNGIDYAVPPPAPKQDRNTGTQVYYPYDSARARKAFMKVSLTDTLIVSNSVPYAEALENGHSKKAPNGIFRVVIPQVKEDIKKYASIVRKKDFL